MNAGNSQALEELTELLETGKGNEQTFPRKLAAIFILDSEMPFWPYKCLNN
jgi:hypothetical protein